MGRTREFNTEEVLLKTMNLFWTKGYQATSMEDLMSETKLNKQSLYTAFGDKRSLFIKGLDLYIKNILAETEARIINKKSPLKALANALYEIAETENIAHPKGCMVSRTASEIGENDIEISKMLEGFHIKTEALIEKAILEAQKLGEVVDIISAEDISKILMTTITGSRVLQLNGVTKKELRQTFKAFIKLIENKNGRKI